MARKFRKKKVTREPKIRPPVGREEVLRKESPPVTEKDPIGRTDQLVQRKE